MASEYAKRKALQDVAAQPRNKWPFGRGGIWTPEAHAMVEARAALIDQVREEQHRATREVDDEITALYNEAEQLSMQCDAKGAMELKIKAMRLRDAPPPEPQRAEARRVRLAEPEVPDE